MKSVLDSPAPPSDVPTLADGAAALSALTRKIQERHRLDVEIIELTGELQRSGTIEMLEGVTLDTALNLLYRMPAGERGMLLTATDVLRCIPRTMELFRSDTLSWGQVRGMVTEAKRLSVEDRGILDEHIAASRDRFAKMEPDRAIDAVRMVAAELQGARKAERKEAAAERSSFVWAQPSLDGRAKLYGEMDNLSLAIVINGMDAAAPTDDGRPLSQRRADGLVSMAELQLSEGEVVEAGDGVATLHRRLRPAKPSVDVVVDLNDASVTAAGTIAINAPGCLPVLTARAVEALAADASVRVVLVDGARPLTVTKKVHARSVPGDVRTAVLVRDRGDRFPGSRGVIEHIHHFDKDGRGHDVDTLLGLTERSHRRIHRHGWSVSLDPVTAEATFTRGERTWTTLPRGTRLRRPRGERSGEDPPG